jgi:cytoskeletal protein RodZ
MSDVNNIKDRFLNFEPEVDDEHIHQNWERAKFFIPQKKQKKRAVWLWFLSLLGLLSGVAGTGYWLIINDQNKAQVETSETLKQKETNASKQNSSMPEHSSTAISAASSSDMEYSNTKNKGSYEEDNQKTYQADLKERHQQHESTLMTQEKIQPITPTNAVNALSKAAISTPYLKSTLQNSEERNELNNDLRNEQTTVPDELHKNEVTLAALDLEETVVSDTNTIYLSIGEKASARRFTFFTTVGAGFNNSGFVADALQSSLFQSRVNTILQAGLHYKLFRRLNVLAQASYATSFFKHTNKSEGTSFLKRRNSILTSSPNTIAYDTIYYLRTQQTERVNLKNQWYFGLGVDVVCLQYKRLGMSVFSSLDYRLTQYVSEVKIDSQTEIAEIAPQGTAAAVNAPANFDPSERKTKMWYSVFGGNAGIGFSYSIRPDFAIIARPAYYGQLSLVKLKSETLESRKIKQNGVVINLGIAFRL